MAKFTISRFGITIVSFILMFTLFYALLIQGRDIAYFFGFSTSEVVANDVVGIGNTLGGVPGDVSINYKWTSVGFSGKTNAIYDLLLATKILCIQQSSDQFSAKTTDCGSFFYPATMPEQQQIQLINILFKKTFSTDESAVKLNVQEISGDGK